jgi:NAD(P)-dependent dehydrogenase (short-subunit alcohol dehydrogenase family)
VSYVVATRCESLIVEDFYVRVYITLGTMHLGVVQYYCPILLSCLFFIYGDAYNNIYNYESLRRTTLCHRLPTSTSTQYQFSTSDTMSQSFAGKVIIVTGAASGIGCATATKLSRMGATLALCDIASLNQTLSFCEGSHFPSIFDISSPSSCNDFVAQVVEKYSKIDHVFNCAGVNPTHLATETITDDYWDKIINSNLRGLFNMTRACIPHLLPGATFVNISSSCGLAPVSRFAVYCASKYGIIGFSKSLALELGPKGIRTNVVAPGLIETPTNASVMAGKDDVAFMEKHIAMGRFGSPEEVADSVVFLMGDGARYMNGSVLEVNGGL